MVFCMFNFSCCQLVWLSVVDWLVELEARFGTAIGCWCNAFERVERDERDERVERGYNNIMIMNTLI